MRQAITTRYAGPTNTRGSRIIAKANAGTITIPYPHELNTEQGHAKAARALVEKLAKEGGRGWCGVWVAGGLPDERGNCYVHIGDDVRTEYMGIEYSDWFAVAFVATGEARA